MYRTALKHALDNMSCWGRRPGFGVTPDRPPVGPHYRVHHLARCY